MGLFSFSGKKIGEFIGNRIGQSKGISSYSEKNIFDKIFTNKEKYISKSKKNEKNKFGKIGKNIGKGVDIASGIQNF